MPIYEYRCPVCKRRVEDLRSLLDDSPVYCPDEVHKERGETVMMDRIISAPSFRMGGVEGMGRIRNKLIERNDAYHNSSKGQEEHRANVTAAHKRLGLGGDS